MLRISVAMCTYNGERFLPEQLDSIAQQALPPSELVICDDGSADRTPEIVQAFARTAGFPVRFVRNETNLGVTLNFAKCIALCSGDLVALSDQDDIWLPRKLARFAELFERHPDITCVFSNALLMDQQSQPIGQDSWSRFLFTLPLQERMFEGDAPGVLLKLPVVSGAAMVFRASLKQHAFPIPKDWVHDTWLAWIAALSGRLVPIPDCLIQYRIHGAQQLGLSAETGRERLKRLGAAAWLQRERHEAQRQLEHMAITYAELAAFAEARQLGSSGVRAAIAEKAAFAERARKLLNMPRLLRAAPSLSLARDYARFTPRGTETILRHAVL